MIVALDVHYDDDRDCACTAAVWFDDWSQPAPDDIWLHHSQGLQPYVAGEFYRRELPCMLPLVRDMLAAHSPRLLVVDAHVDLAPGRPGLGRHLFDAIDGRVHVVGVAKRAFHEGVGEPVLRGDSQNPLWITASDDLSEAVEGVRSMAGEFRIPTLLKQVDRLAREGLIEGP
ncbi:MAG: endonuclease V [Myxococcales bacterium]|nr:endonuclease V [Myxococcales bacterium]